jgi:hypothetical protein
MEIHDTLFAWSIFAPPYQGPETDRQTHPSDNAKHSSIDATMPKDRSLTGQFTLTANLNPVNGNPNTGVFDPLVGVSLGYRLTFKIASESLGADPLAGEKTRTITTGPVKIAFPGATGALLTTTIPSTLNGASLSLLLTARDGAAVLQGFNFVGSPLNQYFGFELAGGATRLKLDGAGYPVLGPFDIATSTAMMRRYVTPFAMTDFAMGPAGIKFK